MDIRPLMPGAPPLMQAPSAAPPPSLQTGGAEEAEPEADKASKEPGELQEAFTDFVGQTLFGSMLASMRKTVGKPAYMHGGRTEEVFQKQLDQIIVEQLTDASAQEIAQPMFDLFQMQRRG